MAPWTKYAIGSALVLGSLRLGMVYMRSAQPRLPAPAITVADPEGLSEKKARQAEQAAKIATLLDASPGAFQGELAFREARDDVTRVLRSVAREANESRAFAVGYAAQELEALVMKDPRAACGKHGKDKLDAALASAPADVKKRLEEPLAIVDRHLARACKLRPRTPEEAAAE